MTSRAKPIPEGFHTATPDPTLPDLSLRFSPGAPAAVSAPPSLTVAASVSNLAA